MLSAIQAFFAAHAVVATFFYGYLLSGVVNAAFEYLKLHESSSAALRTLDGVLSMFGLDAGVIVNLVRKWLGGPPAGPKAGTPVIASDPDMTPTRPSSLKMAILAGVVLLLGCPAVQDVLRFSADEVQCVFSQTDHGNTVAAAVVACGITNTPDVLKFFEDLVAQRAAAHRAAACERAAAAAQDGGAR